MKHFRLITPAILLLCMLGGSSRVQAAAIVTDAAFNANVTPLNDDGSQFINNIGFTLNFFGTNYSGLHLNNNGNVTFDMFLPTFTPFDLNSTNRVIIAPFFADVDTRTGNPVRYGIGTFEGHTTFGVNSIEVGHFNQEQDRLNSFQLLLVDRGDVGVGDFDIIFNYDQILWEAGTASGGNTDGLGGNSARAGYSNGSGTSLELVGSAINGALIDGGPNELIGNRLNSNIDGRYIFNVRNGVVVPPEVAEPSSIFTVAGLALCFGGASWLRRRRKQAALQTAI